ncbi:MAG: hypothetical protein DMD97_04205 [Candidatus Rokuibacteriota bacterium]|nr:MAG: hypothetical protein DMD97_04205 [Candidatus Rokubacteria bacterium]
MSIARRSPLLVLAALAVLLSFHRTARGFDVVINSQGEFADAYLVNGTAFPPKYVFIDPDPAVPICPDATNPDCSKPPRVGKHVNGKLCFFPPGVGHNRQFVMAEDGYRESCQDWRNSQGQLQPQSRCSVTRRGSRFYIGRNPDGWGVFKKNGKWNKRYNINTAWPGFSTYPQGQGSPTPQPQGNIDPQGCVFDANGNMYGNDVGTGDPTNMTPSDQGSLLVFFPGERHRYDTYCFLDNNLSQAGMPAMDEAGNIYLAETGRGMMWKYSPPFPSSAADCPGTDHLVTTAPTKTMFPVQVTAPTPAAIVRVPGTDHWYIDSVLLPGVPGSGGGIINEYDANGVFVRNIVQNVPPGTLLNPLGMDVGSDGTLYYAELNLNPDTSTGCGRVSMVRFVGGTPQAPQVLGQNLSFPDGVTVIDSSQVHVNFLKLPPAPEPAPSTCNGGG